MRISEQEQIIAPVSLLLFPLHWGLFQTIACASTFSSLSTSGAASTGLLYNEAVGHFLTEDQFVQAVGIATLLPGSDALQRAMFVGYTVAGVAGGIGYEAAAENPALQVASANHADVTILHVVPPTDLGCPTTRGLRGHTDDLAETNTLPGCSLRHAPEIAQNAGLNTKAIARQGIIVGEILSELREGNYDKLCMGSSYSATTLRQYYSPHVTAEVAGSAHCPVWTARYQHR